MTRVNELMRGLVRADEAVNVRDLAAMMRRENSSSALVMRHGEPYGMVTESDLVKRVLAEGYNPEKFFARDIATQPLRAISASADVVEAARLMKTFNVRRLLVTQDGQMVGVVNAEEIAKNLPRISFSERIMETHVFAPSGLGR